MAEKYATQKEVDRVERKLEGFILLTFGFVVILVLAQTMSYQSQNLQNYLFIWGFLVIILGGVTIFKNRPDTPLNRLIFGRKSKSK